MSTMPEKLPLTYQQEWLWALLQQSAAWNCTLASGWRLKGSLNISGLRQSISQVVRAHGVLRTRIVAGGRGTSQEIIEPSEQVLECVRVAGSTAAEIEKSAAALFEELAGHQFDVTAEPPLKFELLELSENEHWLLLAIHRLLVDCFAVDRIFSEIWLTYRATMLGEPAGATCAQQYGSYAFIQRQAHDKWAEKHAAYWEGKLDGALQLHWPLADSEVRAPVGALGRMKCVFGMKLSTAVRDLARRARSLTGTVILAMYVAVLWRWCRQRDFVVPFNIAGRQAEHRSVIGFFSHILYLRIQLNGTETFTELLGRVSNEFYQALSHQDFGIMPTQRPELLVGTFVQWSTWHPEAGPGTAGPELAVDRLAVRDFEEDMTAIPPGMVAVEVSFVDAKDGIHALGCYRADRFTASTMDRFMEDLRATAEQFVRDPHKSMTELPFSTNVNVESGSR
jgi:non-ribosomal peptide synthetase component F